MKILIDTSENLDKLNAEISEGFNKGFGTECANYCDVQTDEVGNFFMLIDENDLRLPIQYLTIKQKEGLISYQVDEFNNACK